MNEFRVTDIIMIFAVLVAPAVAVQISVFLGERSETRKKKLWIFRALMATRNASLDSRHIEALNLVEVDFDVNIPKEREVIDRWRLYFDHLNSIDKFPIETWASKKAELLVDLLFSMAVSLGYKYDRSLIKGGTYYPKGHSEADQEFREIRKLFLEVLQGNRAIPMNAYVVGMQQEQPPQTPKRVEGEDKSK